MYHRNNKKLTRRSVDTGLFLSDSSIQALACPGGCGRSPLRQPRCSATTCDAIHLATPRAAPPKYTDPTEGPAPAGAGWAAGYLVSALTVMALTRMTPRTGTASPRLS